MILLLFSSHSDLFYIRNHLPVPQIDLKDYKLELAIEEKIKKTLDFEAIKRYDKHTITAAIMCGGNRRSEMSKVYAIQKSKITVLSSNNIYVALYL